MLFNLANGMIYLFSGAAFHDSEEFGPRLFFFGGIDDVCF
jgi:hypothetical protein